MAHNFSARARAIATIANGNYNTGYEVPEVQERVLLALQREGLLRFKRSYRGKPDLWSVTPAGHAALNRYAGRVRRPRKAKPERVDTQGGANHNVLDWIESALRAVLVKVEQLKKGS
jgi:hypothetical protein